jgi:hypothetical protein
MLLYAAEHFFINTLHGPRRKLSLYCYGGVFSDPLPNNGHPLASRVGFRRDMFTESFPSIESIGHNMFYNAVLFCNEIIFLCSSFEKFTLIVCAR